MNKAKVLKDQFSGGKEKKKYCNKNDVVEIISLHHNVVIVEFKKERFSVKVDDLMNC